MHYGPMITFIQIKKFAAMSSCTKCKSKNKFSDFHSRAKCTRVIFVTIAHSAGYPKTESHKQKLVI